MPRGSLVEFRLALLEDFHAGYTIRLAGLLAAAQRYGASCRRGADGRWQGCGHAMTALADCGRQIYEYVTDWLPLVGQLPLDGDAPETRLVAAVLDFHAGRVSRLPPADRMQLGRRMLDAARAFAGQATA